MHHLVQRLMRGLIFCSVTIAITACTGFTDLADSEQVPPHEVVRRDWGAENTRLRGTRALVSKLADMAQPA